MIQTKNRIKKEVPLLVAHALKKHKCIIDHDACTTNAPIGLVHAPPMHQ